MKQSDKILSNLHLAEILTQAVRGSTLDTTAVGWNVTLNSCCVVTSSKLLVLGLPAANDRNSQQLLVHAGIVLENLQDLLSSQLLSQVCRVALLPHELSCTKERGGLLGLPSDDRVPLVQAEGKITVTADPLGVVRVHDGFGGRTDGNGDLSHRSVNGKA